MNKYMLISVCEREIMTDLFENFQDARKTMLKELYSQAKENDVEVDTTQVLVDDEELYGYGNDWAWSNVDDDYYWDWKIVEVP